MYLNTQTRLQENISNAWKMWANWLMGAVGIIASIWVQLPTEQQQAIISHLPFPLWVLPILASVIGIVLRVLPQKNLPRK